MTMILPIVAGLGALYAYYRYEQGKKAATLQSALQQSAPPSGYAQPAPSGVTYPPATTNANPVDANGKPTANVIRYQQANPMPSGKTYYPADGDISGIVLVRLSGIPTGVVPSQSGKTLLTYADLGKLNGFVTAGDFNTWIKNKKPLALPINFQDGGSRPQASGSVR
jgi:hypothetical protein